LGFVISLLNYPINQRRNVNDASIICFTEKSKKQRVRHFML